MAKGKLVALGEITAWTGHGDKSKPTVTGEQITERAYRACPTGAAACRFGGVEIEPVIARGSNLVGVVAFCESPGSCAMTSESLQQSLSRLEESSTATAKPAPAP